MAKDKKSVLLYCDIIHTVKELSDEEAGKLFKHYLEYINDLNPSAPDKLTQIVFEPIKQNLKRDLKKWEDKSERNSEIAKAGWIKRKDANAYERIKVDANDADKDTVTDKVIDKDILLKKETKQINIEDRKQKFIEDLKPFLLQNFTRETLNDFFNYWSEHNPDGKKMRFEMEKVFDISKRLATWQKNNSKFKQNGKFISKADERARGFAALDAEIDRVLTGVKLPID